MWRSSVCVCCISFECSFSLPFLVADGQGIAKRLQSQVKRITHSIKKDVAYYNNIANTCSATSGLPASITLAEVVSDNWPVWQLVMFNDDDDSVPPVCKRLAVDALNMHKRAEEEKTAVALEMRRVCTHLRHQYDLTVASLNTYRQDEITAPFVRGVISLLLQKCFFIQQEMVACCKSFSGYIDCSIINIFALDDDISVGNVDTGDVSTANTSRLSECGVQVIDASSSSSDSVSDTDTDD